MDDILKTQKLDKSEKLWRRIKGFDSYLISIDGKVFSKRSNSLLTPYERYDGRLQVQLCSNDGARVHKYVHRLVAEAYISGFNPKVYIRHIDGDKSNNHKDNLLPIDAFMNPQLDFVHLGKGRMVRVREWDEVFANVTELAGIIGTDPSNIYRCIRGNRKTHRGLSFHYVN